MTAQWNAPVVKRTEPERVATEREALEQWLDYERETLLMKCAGLTADQLKTRAVPPSALSLLGLVRHMTEVERWWFRMHAAGEQIAFEYSNENDTADFDDLDGADAETDLETFRREVATAREAVRGRTLDDVVASRGHDATRMRDIRWIYVHMIEEYARHNGHADLLRECIDGTVGD
ncbi:MAG: DinB family protein [Acidimicrobiales bacterium]